MERKLVKSGRFRRLAQKAYVGLMLFFLVFFTLLGIALSLYREYLI